jgi:hypothetical protein
VFVREDIESIESVVVKEWWPRGTMWTPQNRKPKRYDRSQLRYPSDLTDDEWALIAPMIAPTKPGDRGLGVCSAFRNAGQSGRSVLRGHGARVPPGDRSSSQCKPP